MNKLKSNPEVALYGLAFLLALGIRLANLGGSYLTDAEATWALQALHLAQGTHPAIGAQPGLVLLAGSLFTIFGSSEFLARLGPAVIGALAVFGPLCFRKQLGKPAALILAFGLTFDPGLVAMARQVDGHVMAVTFTLLGFGFLNLRKPAGAGIFFGLALLGGASVWLGWLGLLIAGGITLLTRSKGGQTQDAMGVEGGLAVPEPGNKPVPTLLWLTGTVIVLGTLFFMEPKGLSGAANSLAAFLQGVTTQGLQPVNLIFAGLIYYEAFPLLVALLTAVWAVFKRSDLDKLLSFVWLVMLGLVILYPNHTVGDLVWVSVPMWALAARGLAGAFGVLESKKLIFGEALLTMALLVCAWLNFTSAMSLQIADATAHWVAIVFMLFFIGVAVILFTWGWNLKAALTGVSLGASILLVLFTLSAAWRAGGQEMRPEQELWLTTPSFQEADLLIQTAGDYSEWNTGSRTGLDLTVVSQTPALEWLFRKFPGVQFVDTLQADGAPALVVTGDQPSLNLATQYTGQSYVYQQGIAWPTMSGSDWVKWMIFRQAPLTKSSVVLWIKSSLFPGSPDFTQKRTP